LPSSPPTIGGLLIRRPDKIDDPIRELLEAKNYSTVCTVAANGSIHALPTWVDTDGEHVLLNSVAGRAWVRNSEREPRLTCNVINRENPHEFVEIRGRVVDLTTAGANAHIHRLAQKYLDLEEYPWLTPEEPRVLIRVQPERLVHMYPGDAVLD
jgi:PPOX class probable F420-dependent enzyme